MHLYKTTKGAVLRQNNQSIMISEDWDTLINQDDLYNYLLNKAAGSDRISEDEAEIYINNHLLSPVGSQSLQKKCSTGPLFIDYIRTDPATNQHKFSDLSK